MMIGGNLKISTLVMTIGGNLKISTIAMIIGSLSEISVVVNVSLFVVIVERNIGKFFSASLKVKLKMSPVQYRTHFYQAA
ncbi:hypothetical protein [Bacillus albus]|uniref:hypothetical protein n=1 Tax=Bacillus albus TaxID=2026189 RepID=UPI001419E7B6